MIVCLFDRLCHATDLSSNSSSGRLQYLHLKSRNNDGIIVISAEDSEYMVPVSDYELTIVPNLEYNVPTRNPGFTPLITEDGYIHECRRCCCKVSMNSAIYSIYSIHSLYILYILYIYALYTLYTL